MKHLLLIPVLAILLVSCATPEERLANFNAMKPVCDAQGKDTLVAQESGLSYCRYENIVQECINKYVDSIDKKYNNPDTVINLQDSDFSLAVKTCNEVFGKK